MYFQEDLHDIRVKIMAGLFCNIFEGFLFTPGRPIRPVADKRIPDIHNGKQTGGQRDLFSDESRG